MGARDPLEDGLQLATAAPDGVEAQGAEEPQGASAGATLQEVVEASSHPSCPTACTLRAGASTKASTRALNTFLGGTLEGANGPAASEAARDPSTNR